jgi:hypothetical protein
MVGESENNRNLLISGHGPRQSFNFNQNLEAVSEVLDQAHLYEFCDIDEERVENEDNYFESSNEDSKNAVNSGAPPKRIQASSKVNFSKLTTDERKRRCKNLAYEVKILKRRIRFLEDKLTYAESMGFVPSKNNETDDHLWFARASKVLRDYP